MSDTLIDIFNNIIKYNDHEIIVILDDDNNPWFSAKNIALLLEYVHTEKAITKYVNDRDKKTFDQLEQFMKNKPANMQPHAVYINEVGLYSLLMSSQQELAKKFRYWVIERVLPSIRKTGEYIAGEKAKQKLMKLNEKLKSLKNELRIVRNNQKRPVHKKGGLVYIVRPSDTRNKKLLKLGFTENFSKRLNTYNISIPDNMEILFEFEVDNPADVEQCTKLFMKTNQYRANKEYYQCSIKKLRDTIVECNNRINNETNQKCIHCNNRVGSFNQLLEHLVTDHNVALDEPLLMDLYGGTNASGSIYAIRHPKDIKNRDYEKTITMETFFSIGLNDVEQFKKNADHLCPYIGKNGREYQLCSFKQLEELLAKDPDNIDYVSGVDDFNSMDEFIISIRKKFNLSDHYEFILDTCHGDQSGGMTIEPVADFSGKNILLKNGNVKMPNGVIVMPNGKVIDPNGSDSDSDKEDMARNRIKKKCDRMQRKMVAHYAKH